MFPVSHIWLLSPFRVWAKLNASGDVIMSGFRLFSFVPFVVGLPVLMAQGVDQEMHERCLAAADYSGCIRANTSTIPAGSVGGSQAGEECDSKGVCVAKPGNDQLGLPKVVGWFYRYKPADNTVFYWAPQSKRVPHKGQPSRYVAIETVLHHYQQPVATKPGYYSEISPAKTTCTPTYGGGKWVNGIWRQNPTGQSCTTSSAQQIWVAGTPGIPGGPRSIKTVEVRDCKDMTRASYQQGRLRGNWSKIVGSDRQNTRKVCKQGSQLDVLAMKL